MQQQLERALSLLQDRGDQDATWRDGLYSALDEVAAEARSVVPRDVRVKPSIGIGNVAAVPWICVFLGENTTRSGYYLVYLFAADGSAVYLSWNQGVTETPAAVVDARREELRAVANELIDTTDLLGDIDLRSKGNLPRQYERGNAFAIRYEASAVPEDERLHADLVRLSEMYGQVHDDGLISWSDTPTLPAGIPHDFRRDLFERAVAELKADREKYGDLHQLACRQLAAWFERRAEYSDEELWAGLRRRFLPFGYVEIDGQRFSQRSQLGLDEDGLRLAEDEGRASAHGNLHWTGLARPVGSERDDLPDVRAGIELLLDDEVLYGERIATLVNGPRHVRGFGIAVWTGLYAMVRGWSEPAVNETVIGAFRRLGWPLNASSPSGLVAEVHERGLALLEYSGLESLADIDWVYWRVLEMKSGSAEEAPWWLFQANPNRHDVDRALSELDELTWTTNQHAAEIQTGHRVFVYRTGSAAGVIAVATVQSDPTEMAEPEHEHGYWRDPRDLAIDTGPRVSIAIDRLVDPPVTRQELLDDPVLRDLPNLKFANATNYPVPPEMARRLLSRITTGAASSPDSGEVSLPDVLRRTAGGAGLWFEPWVLEDLYIALRTKPFLILTGLSGTGKTKVALALQDLLCDAETRAFISVRPDWVDGKSLLGYHNLLTDTFITTPMTEMLLDAEAEYESSRTAARPYIVLLDEMNLARVEHYFSDLLSVLESRRMRADGRPTSDPIILHGNKEGLPTTDGSRVVPSSLRVTPNVYVIGTVNIDETTHPFSRKVLDRANTIELFDVDLAQTGVTTTSPVTATDRQFTRSHFTRGGEFIDLAEPSLDTPTLSELVRLNGVLARDRLHFGYRVRNEVLAFVEQAGAEGLLGQGMEAKRAALDLQVLQKVLPKLAGSRERLERPLQGLLAWCLSQGAHAQDRARGLADDPERLFDSMERITAGAPPPVEVDAPTADPDATSDADAAEPSVGEEVTPISGSAETASVWPLLAEDVRYPRSARKIARMLLQLRDEGYTSFFE